ncbi:MAG: sulfatase [Halobacteriaceae archaeon]
MSDRPNILFIHTDEQRADTLGCYDAPVDTPNIDALAERGTLFEEAHCTHPLCTPSRASLMTGRYPNVNGVWRNGLELPTDQPLLTEELADAGYDTWLAGKGHVAPYHGDPERHPESVQLGCGWDDEEVWEFWRDFDGGYYGFEEVEMTVAHENTGAGHYGLWLHENHADKLHLFEQEHAVEDHDETYPVWKSGVPLEIHSSNWVADRTVEFIDDHADDEDPWFGWVGLPDPHFPFDAPAEYAEKYDPEDVELPVDPHGEVWEDPEPPRFVQLYFERMEWMDYEDGEVTNEMPEEKMREWVANYYAMCDLVDDAVGRILDELEAQGLREDTVVVFTSDHGDWLGDHGLWNKGGVDTRGVTRVPWIIDWPGVSEPGRRVEAPASLVDMMPTFLDAAGVEIPYGVQGESLRPVLNGETDRLRPWAYVQHRHEPQPEDSPLRKINPYDEDVHIKTIVTDSHRLTHVTGVEKEYGELFDLEADVEETNNLYFEEPELRHELEGELIEALVHSEDPLPERQWGV